ncbi:ribonuclease H-like domain-containing protein [Tanacetum coccineum]
MLEFCGNRGIKQEYSNVRTPQQNGVAKRMNMTLIEATRTMLADSLLPTTFWAEAVSTACYIFNRVRVTKLQNKTPYELLFGHKPIISYIRPFGCHVTILDTLSVLGKFDSLEKELKQTKLTMGKAIVKLVKKVKKMEVVLKRRHVVLTDSEDEDAENSSKQGRNLQEEDLDLFKLAIVLQKAKQIQDFRPTQ